MKIESYVGVDGLRFGMLPAAVEQSIGPSEERDRNYLGEVIEYRHDRNLITTYSQDKGLVEIGFNPGVGEVLIEGVSLFDLSPAVVLRQLVEMDGQALELAGFVVFTKLGVALSGFHDTPPVDLAVTVFTRGRWDGQAAKMKPFHLGIS